MKKKCCIFFLLVPQWKIRFYSIFLQCTVNLKCWTFWCWHGKSIVHCESMWGFYFLVSLGVVYKFDPSWKVWHLLWVIHLYVRSSWIRVRRVPSFSTSAFFTDDRKENKKFKYVNMNSFPAVSKQHLLYFIPHRDGAYELMLHTNQPLQTELTWKALSRSDPVLYYLKETGLRNKHLYMMPV